MEIMLRGQDGALTYDFEPVPNIIASNGVPLIKLKSPDILYGGSDSLTFTVRFLIFQSLLLHLVYHSWCIKSTKS